MADWTDTSELAVAVGDLPRASWANGVVDNLQYLYNTPAVTVRMTTTQQVASGNDSLISWSEATWDTTDGDMWDAGAPGSILIPFAGVYRFTCATLWDGNDDNEKRAIFLERNDARIRGVQVLATDPAEIILTGTTSVAANDYLEFVVRQTSGAPLDLMPLRTVCTVEFVRPDPSA